MEEKFVEPAPQAAGCDQIFDDKFQDEMEVDEPEELCWYADHYV